MNNLFMGIDTGTQGVRIGICDWNGNIKSESEKKWDTDFPELGWAEQDPDVWWSNILEAVYESLGNLKEEEKKSIKYCCVCATSSTVIAVNENGDPLMPAIMWMDARSKKEMKAINDTHHEVLSYCGDEVSFEWLIPKALWIKHNRPEIYNKSYKIIEQLDWINYKLTGVYCASICNASCKWNYVRSKGGFSKEFFEKIGFGDYEEKLITDVRKIGDTVGTITKEVASLLGLNPEMTVVQGGIDAHMAFLGMNAFAEKKMGIIMGTSFVHLSQARQRPVIKGIWGPYDSAVMDDMWLMEGGQISAGGLVNWFRENFHIPKIDEDPFKALKSALDDVRPGSEGVTVLDFFQGNRTPYKNAYAKGVIYGLNIKHTWKHIYRAILEGVAFGTKNIIDNQKRQGYDVDKIVACGGVTKDEGWMQIISDITGREIIVNRYNQAGVMGCCVAAASALEKGVSLQETADRMVKAQKVYIPDCKRMPEYELPYQNYLKLYRNLVVMMSE